MSKDEMMKVHVSLEEFARLVALAKKNRGVTWAAKWLRGTLANIPDEDLVEFFISAVPEIKK